MFPRPALSPPKPRRQRFALLDPGDDSPVVVVQLPVSENEWLYLATVFPRGAAINLPGGHFTAGQLYGAMRDAMDQDIARMAGARGGSRRGMRRGG